MSLLDYPARVFYKYASVVSIFLMKRRLKDDKGDPAKWILLAKLYEVRESRQEAIETIKTAMKLFPDRPILKSHLERLQGTAPGRK